MYCLSGVGAGFEQGTKSKRDGRSDHDESDHDGKRIRIRNTLAFAVSIML
jgi:hypothetical protein